MKTLAETQTDFTSRIRHENERLREALKPFSDAVFNDNGDMTIDLGLATSDDYVRAYFAYRRARALIQEPKA